MQDFSEKLVSLRRSKGLSQEQLAQALGVSRQSVSKWESGGAMPELGKLLALSDLFGVSVDTLIRAGGASVPSEAVNVSNEEFQQVSHQLSEIQATLRRREGFEYKSRHTLFGLPLVHIHVSRYRLCVARGILAIGNISIGLLSIGGFALGGICLGGFALGLLAVAGLCAGILALGGLSLGILAFGGVAIGCYAFGGVAVASQLAVGGAAVGRVAVGAAAKGQEVLLTDGASSAQILSFLQTHFPGLGSFFSGLMSLFVQ